MACSCRFAQVPGYDAPLQAALQSDEWPDAVWLRSAMTFGAIRTGSQPVNHDLLPAIAMGGHFLGLLGALPCLLILRSGYSPGENAPRRYALQPAMLVPSHRCWLSALVQAYRYPPQRGVVYAGVHTVP